MTIEQWKVIQEKKYCNSMIFHDKWHKCLGKRQFSTNIWLFLKKNQRLKWMHAERTGTYACWNMCFRHRTYDASTYRMAKQITTKHLNLCNLLLKQRPVKCKINTNCFLMTLQMAQRVVRWTVTPAVTQTMLTTSMHITVTNRKILMTCSCSGGHFMVVYRYIFINKYEKKSLRGDWVKIRRKHFPLHLQQFIQWMFTINTLMTQIAIHQQIWTRCYL